MYNFTNEHIITVLQQQELQ